MKIGFDARRYFLNRTGLGDYSRNLVHHLHQLHPEIDIHLYSSDVGSHYPLPDYTTLHSRGKSPSIYWRNYGIPKAIKKEGLDLYHGLSNELPLGIQKSGIPAIVTIHDLLFIRYPGHYAHFDRKIYTLKTKKAARLANHIISISETTKKDLVEIFGIDPAKISVISPIATFQPKPRIESGSIPRKGGSERPILLCVSSFQKRKNLERLIEAYNLSDCGFKLIIAGRKGETSRECAFLADQKKSGQKAILKFDVSHAALESLFEQASAFVYPSVYEGFGMPVLDALQHGLPVLTSRGTSMEEIAGTAGAYFDPEDTNSILRVLSELNDENALSVQKSHIAERLQLFSGSAMTKKLINIYQSV